MVGIDRFEKVKVVKALKGAKRDGSILSAGAGAWCPAFSRLKRPGKNGAGGGTRTLTSR